MKLSMKLGLYFLSFTLSLGACRTQKKSELDTLGPEAALDGPLSFTFYDPAAFGKRCPNPGGADGGIAPAEGMKIIAFTCAENWIEVKDPNNPPDIEAHTISNANKAGHNIRSKKEYLDKGLTLCAGRCVKREGTKYYINLPDCGNVCEKFKSTYTLTDGSTGKTAKVFVESVCPARHWKNILNAELGVADNHCATPNHIDISTAIEGKFGIDRSHQGKRFVTLTAGDDAPLPPGPQTQPPSSVTPPTAPPPSADGTSGLNAPQCPGNVSCKGGWGWLKSGESGCGPTSPYWKDKGCSCKC